VIQGRVAVVNPFGSVLTQNKRSLALLWEHRDALPGELRAAISRTLPETRRLECLPEAALLDERESWVLKSDYGCEGEEVFIGPDCSQEEWVKVVHAAVPGRWIAQRYFGARRNTRGEAVNYGVYVVAGQACGVLARAQVGATDHGAVVLPTLVEAI